jgi:hypothetical protein
MLWRRRQRAKKALRRTARSRVLEDGGHDSGPCSARWIAKAQTTRIVTGVARALRFSALVLPDQTPASSQHRRDWRHWAYLRRHVLTLRSWRQVHQRSRWPRCPSRAAVLGPVRLFPAWLVVALCGLPFAKDQSAGSASVPPPVGPGQPRLADKEFLHRIAAEPSSVGMRHPRAFVFGE